MAWCRAVLALLLLQAALVASIPQATFPVNSQVPPVARVHDPYHFRFSEQTFTPSTPPVSLSLHAAPAWLHLDGPARTFSGTPAAGDVGPVSFQLRATDPHGSFDMPVTLVVVDRAPPERHVNVTAILLQSGTLSDPTTLASYPTDAFDVRLGPGAFVGTSSLTYYATSSDRSPLPSWIAFDSTAVAFAGRTPDPAASPRDFGVTCFATSIPGFAEAEITFTIHVANHQLAFHVGEATWEIAPGAGLSAHLAEDLLLDGRVISPTEIASAQVLGAAWVRVDSTTLELSGSPPPHLTQQLASVSVQDVYNDTAALSLTLNVVHALISGQIGSIAISTGRYFQKTFSSTLFTASDVRVNVSLGAASAWLSFDAANLTLQGDVPAGVPRQSLEANLTASSPSLGMTESQAVRLDFGPDATDVASTTPSAASATGTSNGMQHHHDSDHHGLSPGEIAVAVVIPIIAVAAAALGLCLFFCGRRRRREHYQRDVEHVNEKDGRAPVAGIGAVRTVPEAAEGLRQATDASLPGTALGLEDLTRSGSTTTEGAVETFYSSSSTDPEAASILGHRAPDRPKARRPYSPGPRSRALPGLAGRHGETAPGSAPFFDRRRLVPGIGHGRSSYGLESASSGDTDRRRSIAAPSSMSGLGSSRELSPESGQVSHRARASMSTAERRNHRRATLRMVGGTSMVSPSRTRGIGHRPSQYRVSPRQSSSPFFSSRRESRLPATSKPSSSSGEASVGGEQDRTRYRPWKARGDSWPEGFPRVLRQSSRYSSSSRGSLFVDAERISWRAPDEESTRGGAAERASEEPGLPWGGEPALQDRFPTHRRGWSMASSLASHYDRGEADCGRGRAFL